MGIKSKFDFENETLFSKFVSIKGLIETLSNDEDMSYSKVATFIVRHLGRTESPPQFYSIDPIRGALMSARPSTLQDLMGEVVDSGAFGKVHNKFGWAADEVHKFLREIGVTPIPIIPAWEQENDESENAESNPSPEILKIGGETFARLMRAIEAFPAKYPEYASKPPKLNVDVRLWLHESGLVTDGQKGREASVFGKIIAEHFKL